MDSLTVSAADCPVSGSEEALYMSSQRYRAAVGALSQLMRFTRPDIAFHVGVCSRYLHNPGRAHLQYLKRLVRYVIATRNLEFELAPTGTHLTAAALDSSVSVEGLLRFSGFADADFANADLARSTAGYGFFFGSALISWSSRILASTTTSSTHSELTALYHASTEAAFLRSLFTALRYLDSSVSIDVFSDNAAAIQNAIYHMVTSRNKHFEAKIHFVRQLAQSGFITVRHISGSLNPADIWTKPLPLAKFSGYRLQLGLIPGPVSSMSESKPSSSHTTPHAPHPA